MGSRCCCGPPPRRRMKIHLPRLQPAHHRQDWIEGAAARLPGSHFSEGGRGDPRARKCGRGAAPCTPDSPSRKNGRRRRRRHRPQPKGSSFCACWAQRWTPRARGRPASPPWRSRLLHRCFRRGDSGGSSRATSEPPSPPSASRSEARAGWPPAANPSLLARLAPLRNSGAKGNL